jgi:hypothetical protein
VRKGDKGKDVSAADGAAADTLQTGGLRARPAARCHPLYSSTVTTQQARNFERGAAPAADGATSHG